jgi:PPOX class probable F420-dependent enzyme
MGLGDEKYISVTTFRKSGAAVSTPTWIVPLSEGRFGFWTSSATGKVKRLRNNYHLTLQPSDGRGRVRPGTAPVNGTALLIASGPDFDAIQSQVRAKYGAMVTISRFFNTLGHLGKGPHPYGDLGVVITLDD